MAYKSPYVWPNPAFPFRLYYEGKECRIFIIENIMHNWEWMSKYSGKIRDTDFFFVYCGWYHDEYFADQAAKIFDELSLKKENFFIMFNSELEMSNFSKVGVDGDIINHNCWLDPGLMQCLPNEPKEYDAIYVGRLSPFKRHELASGVDNLALIAGLDHGNTSKKDVPAYAYRNDHVLRADEVCIKINQSRCGLLLSEKEGACFSSSEYLLCGVPVVSTYSFGGRDVWYDDYNSIQCEPDQEAVKRAVDWFVENQPDPMKIRNNHIQLSNIHRQRFVTTLGNVFARFGVRLDASVYFNDTYFHKMRSSMQPDFETIFS